MPAPESRNETFARPFLPNLTFCGLVSLSKPGLSNVLEAIFRVSFFPLAFFPFLALILTGMPFLRIFFWLLLLTLSETLFFAATVAPSAARADEARVAQSVTASRAASSRDILIKTILSSVRR